MEGKVTPSEKHLQSDHGNDVEPTEVTTPKEVRQKTSLQSNVRVEITVCGEALVMCSSIVEVLEADHELHSSEESGETVGDYRFGGQT